MTGMPEGAVVDEVPAYGFRCAWCDADFEVATADARIAAKAADTAGWRAALGVSTRWGEGWHNTCPDCASGMSGTVRLAA
jgi:hypothetical protein